MLVTGHVVVCGLDHLGLRTIAELRTRDETVVAIGPNADVAERLEAAEVRLVIGDHRLSRTLSDADVETAAVIVLTGDRDLDNLNTALAAHQLNPSIRIVIRMFDQELGSHIPELFPDAVALSSSALAAPGFVSAAIDGESGSRFRLAGRSISSRESADPPRAATSIPIARLYRDRTVELLPDATSTEPGLILVDIGAPESETDPAPVTSVDRTSVPRPSRSVGRSVKRWFQTSDRRLLRFVAILIVLAIGSAVVFDIVARLTPLDAVSYVITLLTGASLPADIEAATSNDALRVYAIFLSVVGAAIVAVVYAFITDALIRSRLLQTLGRRTIPATIHDHVIVAGLGSIGYRVALGIAARGVPVVAVEVSDDGRFVSPTRAAGIPVYIGDARHPEVLEELHLATARALVAATSDDLVNLSTVLNARKVRSQLDQRIGRKLRVVVRLFDPEFAVRVQQGFDIRFTRSVSALAAPAFAAAAVGSEVVASVPVGDKRVILFARLQVSEGSQLEGRMARSLDEVGALRVLAVADPGAEDARWDVPAEEILDAGEEVVVAATRAGLAHLLQLAATAAAQATNTEIATTGSPIGVADRVDPSSEPPPAVDQAAGAPAAGTG